MRQHSDTAEDSDQGEEEGDVEEMTEQVRQLEELLASKKAQSVDHGTSSAAGPRIGFPNHSSAPNLLESSQCQGEQPGAAGGVTPPAQSLPTIATEPIIQRHPSSSSLSSGPQGSVGSVVVGNGPAMSSRAPVPQNSPGSRGDARELSEMLKKVGPLHFKQVVMTHNSGSCSLNVAFDFQTSCDTPISVAKEFVDIHPELKWEELLKSIEISLVARCQKILQATEKDPGRAGDEADKIPNGNCEGDSSLVALGLSGASKMALSADIFQSKVAAGEDKVKEQVKILQRSLAFLLDVPEERYQAGEWCDATLKAVNTFQENQKIKPSGAVDAKLWESIIDEAKKKWQKDGQAKKKWQEEQAKREEEEKRRKKETELLKKKKDEAEANQRLMENQIRMDKLMGDAVGNLPAPAKNKDTGSSVTPSKVPPGSIQVGTASGPSVGATAVASAPAGIPAQLTQSS